MLKYINAIVQDEVVSHLSLDALHPLMQESFVALFSSEPRFTITEEPIPEGSKWNGTEWVPPVE